MVDIIDNCLLDTEEYIYIENDEETKDDNISVYLYIILFIILISLYFLINY